MLPLAPNISWSNYESRDINNSLTHDLYHRLTEQLVQR